MLFTKKKRMNNPVTPRPPPPPPTKKEKIQYSFQFAGDNSIRFVMIETLIPSFLPDNENTYDFKIGVTIHEPDKPNQTKQEPAITIIELDQTEPSLDFSFARDRLQQTMMLFSEDGKNTDNISVQYDGYFGLRALHPTLALRLSITEEYPYLQDDRFSLLRYLSLQHHMASSIMGLSEITESGPDSDLSDPIEGVGVMRNRTPSSNSMVNDIIPYMEPVIIDNTNVVCGSDKRSKIVGMDELVSGEVAQNTPGFHFRIVSSDFKADNTHFFSESSDPASLSSETRTSYMNKGRSLPLLNLYTNPERGYDIIASPDNFVQS
jgi:hypothetical protein